MAKCVLFVVINIRVFGSHKLLFRFFVDKSNGKYQSVRLMDAISCVKLFHSHLCHHKTVIEMREIANHKHLFSFSDAALFKCAVNEACTQASKILKKKNSVQNKINIQYKYLLMCRHRERHTTHDT